VVSTAHHEYFGIAITEAIYAGSFPILPNRLVYPERIPPRFHQQCLYSDDADLVSKLVWAAEHRSEAARIAASLKPDMAIFDWSLIAPRYDETFERLRPP
jgi:hypothetical protein